MPYIHFLPLASPNALYPLNSLVNPQDLLWGAAPLREIWKNKILKEGLEDQIQGRQIHLSPILLPVASVLSDLKADGLTHAFARGDELVWCVGDPATKEHPVKQVPDHWPFLDRPAQLFALANEAIASTLMYAQDHWAAQPVQELPPHVTHIGSSEDLFVSPDAKLLGCTLNTTTGPIIIGPGAEVQEGANLRGPFMLGVESTVKMGAKIYGPTIIGPHCKVGGEVSNSVFLGYANKGHDGFVGNSVIGHWCNLGADTNTSNLKNTYGEVMVYDGELGGLAPSGLQFCGLIMGDHSKCGINTMFNTGTVVGVGCNIYDSGFPPKHIPSFSWGSAGGGWVEHDLEKMLNTARAVMRRRGVELDEAAEQRIRRAHAAAFPSGGK
jgi:UDP-N-acetylglucosamine diphosphorylase/glucosamine-1-phosphate N-acetyltransferase